jgi:hypothetical protein
VRTDLRVGPEAEPEIEGVTLTDRPIDDVFAEGKPVSVRLTKGTHPRSRESSAHRVGPLDPE